MGRGGVGEGVGYLLTCYKEHNEMDLHASTHKGSADDGKRCGVYGARRTVSVIVAFHERSEYGGVPGADVTEGRRI